MAKSSTPEVRASNSIEATAPVERITVGLLARVAEELRRLRNRTGMSKADLINRSVSLYSYIDSRIAAGDEVLLRNQAGEMERIRLL